MGLRFGLDPGQGPSNSMTSSPNHLFTAAVRWQGAPSCRKMVHLSIGMCAGSVSLRIFRYTPPLMVVFFGTNHRPSRLALAKLAQTIIVGACLTVGTTYLILYLWFVGIPTCLTYDGDCENVDSSENMTF